MAEWLKRGGAVGARAELDRQVRETVERTLADIQVLYVGSPDPKVFFHVCNAGYDFLEVRFVCDVLYHT